MTLKDILGFPEHQEKATYGLGYALTMNTDKDSAVFNRAGGMQTL